VVVQGHQVQVVLQEVLVRAVVQEHLVLQELVVVQGHQVQVVLQEVLVRAEVQGQAAPQVPAEHLPIIQVFQQIVLV
jgi:hypothetical protein